MTTSGGLPISGVHGGRDPARAPTGNRERSGKLGVFDLIIHPGQHQSSNSGNYGRQNNDGPVKTLFRVIVAVLSLAVVVVLFFFGVAVVMVVGPPALSSVAGTVAGMWTGVGVGFSALPHILSWMFLSPPISAGVLGAISGAAGAFFVRVWRYYEKQERSFLRALFSPEVFSANPYSFTVNVLVSGLIGYGVAAGVASLGVFHSPTYNPAMIAEALASHGPCSGLDCIWEVAFSVGALLVIGAILAVAIGAIIGGIIGVAFTSIGVTTVIHGAAEGVVFRLFASYRPEKLSSSRSAYLVTGAVNGASEAVAVGMLTGVVLGIGRLVGIIG